MRVIAIRHAKSDYPAGVADHDRPLAPRGRLDAPAVGAWLDLHVTWEGAPPTVMVSSAVRAQQTWQGIRSSLSSVWSHAVVVDEPHAYAATARQLRELISQRDVNDLVVIAHNPGLHDLVLEAASGPHRDAASVKFPTCAVAVLEARDPQSWSPGRYEVVDFAVPRG